MQDYKNISVWQKAHQCVLELYKVTKGFPKDEIYGLTSQIRRAATSITANIAEGACRKTDNDFAHFLQMSLGSASETDYFILLAKDLEYINQEQAKILMNDIDEIQRMLVALIKK